MSGENKKDELKEIIPVLWNQYQHMYESRNNKIHNKINFLLVAVSFLPIISITIYGISKYSLFLIPAGFQLIAFLILLRSFFFKSSIPWTTIENAIEHLKSDNIHKFFFAQAKAGENQTKDEVDYMQSIINLSLSLIIFSVYSFIVASYFYMYVAKSFEWVLSYLALLVLSALFILIMKRNQLSQTIERLKDNSSRDFDEDFNAIFKKIETQFLL